MNAIRLLESQHEEVSALFERFEASDDDAEKLRLFEQIADALAVHATIEEHQFYPSVRARDTRRELAEAYDEHIEIKKLLLDAMRSTSAPGWDGMVAALKGAVEHHVEEEEGELFPKVRRLLEANALEAIGQQMEAEAAELEAEGAPRDHVTAELEPPQPMA